MHLSKHVKITRVKTAQVAGTTDITSDTIDMQGFDGVLFLAHMGTITSGAVTSLKGQQGAASGMGDAADLEGTGVTIADTDDDKVIGLDIFEPRERYVRCIVDRGTQNAVVDSITAIQYCKQGLLPTTHDSTTVGTVEAHRSPAEGTA
jgi:hypothetical protein